jgi:purine-binding chemotaxis protein CheW
MENTLTDERDAVPVLLFRVRSRLCALPIVHVVETMRPLPIEPLAGAPVAVKGLALIRGTALPVVALAILIDGKDEHPTRFVTVRAGEYQVALAVGSVHGVHGIAAASLRDLPLVLRYADNNAVLSIGRLDAELLLVLNAARLVPDGIWPARNAAEAPH